jgi:nicotinate-nucleotide pyrophosphorylase
MGQEVDMSSILKKSAVFAAAFLVCSSVAAHAGTVEVKVAFPFVVQGQTMPAGQYLVESEGSSAVLIRGEKGNHETGYRLSGIWESGTDGRTIARR